MVIRLEHYEKKNVNLDLTPLEHQTKSPGGFVVPLSNRERWTCRSEVKGRLASLASVARSGTQLTMSPSSRSWPPAAEDAPTTASTSSGFYSSFRGFLGTRARGATHLLALAATFLQWRTPKERWGGGGGSGDTQPGSGLGQWRRQAPGSPGRCLGRGR